MRSRRRGGGDEMFSRRQEVQHKVLDVAVERPLTWASTVVDEGSQSGVQFDGVVRRA